MATKGSKQYSTQGGIEESMRNDKMIVTRRAPSSKNASLPHKDTRNDNESKGQDPFKKTMKSSLRECLND